MGIVIESVKRRSGGRRFWWLFVTLLILLNVTLWSRPLIAGWLGSVALRSASDDEFKSSANYIQWSRYVWRQSPEAALAAARLARREGKLDDFALQLKRARYLGVSTARTEHERWLASAQSGQFTQVGMKFNEMIAAARGDEPQICEAFAQGYMRMRDFSAALAILKAWAEDYPTDARPHAWLGLIYAELQTNESAEKAFREALRIDKRNARAAQGLGSLLLDLKLPGEAIPYFRIAVDNQALEPEAAVGLASALQAMSNSDEAMTVLEAAYARFPENNSILVALSDALIKVGNYAAAEKLLSPPVKSGTRRRELRYFYAIALRGLGRTDEAVEHFAYAAEANAAIVAANRKIAQVAERPADVELRYSIGEVQLRYGNIEDGLMWLNSALEIEPSHSACHSALADFYQSHSGEDASYISLAKWHRAVGEKVAANRVEEKKAESQ